jgi:hypothetical protein
MAKKKKKKKGNMEHKPFLLLWYLMQYPAQMWEGALESSCTYPTIGEVHYQIDSSQNKSKLFYPAVWKHIAERCKMAWLD